MLEYEAREVFFDVKRLFTWVSDKENFGKDDHYQDFAKEVEAGEPFLGDVEWSEPEAGTRNFQRDESDGVILKRRDHAHQLFFGKTCR